MDAEALGDEPVRSANHAYATNLAATTSNRIAEAPRLSVVRRYPTTR
jgi:hypothetical protein